MTNREKAEQMVAEKLGFKVTIEDAMFFIYRPERELPTLLTDSEGTKLYAAQAWAVSLQEQLLNKEGQ